MNNLLHYLGLIERPIIIAERTKKDDIILNNRKTISSWIDNAITYTENKSIINKLEELKNIILEDFELTKVLSIWKDVKAELLNVKGISKSKEKRLPEKNKNTHYDIDIDIKYIKGVGEKRSELLKRLGIETVRDLLYFFPRDYQDRTKLSRFDEIKEGEHITAFGRIVDTVKKEVKGRRSIITALASDGHGVIEIVWWGMPYLYNKLGRGGMILISGKATIFGGRLQFVNPEFELGEDFDRVNYSRIVPIYPLTEGIFQKNMRRIIYYALRVYLPDIIDYVPGKILNEEDLPDIKKAISNIHFPENILMIDKARKRLIFDSLFLLQIEVLRRRSILKERSGISLKCNGELVEHYIDTLPFKPTIAQMRAFNEIKEDLESAKPMMRLLQGDVGCGKTLVATLSSLMTIEAGYQVAIMAPTEILARQHHRKIKEGLMNFDIDVSLIVGGQRDEDRLDAISRAKSGNISIFIGTHALIQEGVDFGRLGLAIIDEQHRFGVHQRAALLTKGGNPNLLVMTATPIPRTLALTLYGDLDLSLIDEIPPGRGKRNTVIIGEHEKERINEIINNTLLNGGQAFIVYPLVEESEKIDLKASTDAFKNTWLPRFSKYGVALLHGKIPKDEQRMVMEDFEKGNIKLLVTTTVAEVGIDVSGATLMVVECSDRFGLSQLHQLRGRIGRGSEEANCILIKRENITEIAGERLKVLSETEDGFRIAEEDLRLRGPGEYIGTRQSGIPDRVLLAIMKEPELLNKAKSHAGEFLREDPELTGKDGILIKEILENIYGDRLGLTIS
jgi:ATP-dependent DNA helicase RecG